ncbi:MAG TPA: hypothetical protein VNW92_24285 [Polyangiaceae bacterium]|jgi:hypothetical protein|nr:hypothetical protein [Polyangiaceae bacterium]
MATNSRTLTRPQGLATAQRRTRSASFGLAASFPSSDALLVLAAALVALAVFELAAWLTRAPLATLIYSVTCVPLVLFLTALAWERRR